jgi:hypothetical protein
MVFSLGESPIGCPLLGRWNMAAIVYELANGSEGLIVEKTPVLGRCSPSAGNATRSREPS